MTLVQGSVLDTSMIRPLFPHVGASLQSGLFRLTASRNFFLEFHSVCRPPLWSSGQSSWLQIRRPGFDSRNYQKKKVVGLERGPLSLVSTTEELLDRKVAAPV
jgi:hypothetical protein